MSATNKRFLRTGAFKGQTIAVFTSGGDSQGMNAAVRAIVRMGMYLGCKVFFIYEGYQGMVDGGKYIVEASWSSVSSIIHKGGTIIGSARCMDFKERAGRLKAACNLIKHGISNLVCIGGDGSLTGADCFRQEWESLVEELVKTKQITNEEKLKSRSLHLSGLVGSIDNDFCGTDMTIGTDSAMHRIIESVDAIISTAYSHKRTFIMEVMGRHCGYLALVSALACEADYVFIPELPCEEGWEDKMCAKCGQERSNGQRLSIIILAEGAIDFKGNAITGDMVKKVLETKLNHDTRLTVLGHVQRGGNTSAFDRILGSRMGAEAVLALMDATDETEPCVISIVGNQIVRVPLMECVKITKSVAQATADKNFDLALKLRGTSFVRSLNTYLALNQLKPPVKEGGYVFGVMHVGAPACGMNATVRSFVRNSILKGNKVYGIHEGIEGLLSGQFQNLDWGDVFGWACEGGAILGTKRALPGSKCKEIAARLAEFKIDGLFIVGGFEAYQSALTLCEQRSQHPALCIPIVVAPVTISNNVPGTDFTVGADTALNVICSICDRIRQSAQGTKRRVFIIETMGGYCGYLATLGGMAVGADASYIFEEKFNIADLQTDVFHMASKMSEGVQRGLIIRNERASENYNSDFIYRLFSEEGKGIFSTRMNILGHMQQGGVPSPFDRSMGTRIASNAVDWLHDQCKANSKAGKVFTDKHESCVVVGILRKKHAITPVENLKSSTDFEHRLNKVQWWLRLRPLLRILAKHEASYEDEGLYVDQEDEESLKDSDSKSVAPSIARRTSSIKATAQIKMTTTGAKQSSCNCGK